MPSETSVPNESFEYPISARLQTEGSMTLRKRCIGFLKGRHLSSRMPSRCDARESKLPGETADCERKSHAAGNPRPDCGAAKRVPKLVGGIATLFRPQNAKWMNCGAQGTSRADCSFSTGRTRFVKLQFRYEDDMMLRNFLRCRASVERSNVSMAGNPCA